MFSQHASAGGHASSGGSDYSVPENVSSEAQQFLTRSPTGNLPEPEFSGLEKLNRGRAALNKMMLGFAKQIDPDYFLNKEKIAGVPVYWVNSEIPEKPGPAIIYLHGGGHIYGSAEKMIAMPIRVGKATGLPVLSIEYRLAPEHPFPADVEDIVSVYADLLAKGYRAEQIGVFGDSAGGALALALALEARNRGLPMPAAVAVLSPLSDAVHMGDTRIILADADPVLRQPLVKRYKLYVGDTDPTDPLMSPVYGDYSDFPPLLIQVGTRERLLSDSVRLASKARQDGANVQLDVWDGMWHGWQGMPDLPEGDEASREVAEFLTGYMSL
ncbi:MAG: alpha/beta hydrolase [Gammaproteobacteria bacterium]